MAPSQNIDSEYVYINGLDQWLYYLGEDHSKPVILFLHGGPGTPETPFLEFYNKNLKEDFLIVSWEQRGAGKSHFKKIPESSMTMDQFIEDAHSVTQHVKKKFNKKNIYLMGHSWGTLLGIRTIKKYPVDYRAYIAIAQTSNAFEEEKLICEWILQKAREDGNKKAIKELKRACQPEVNKELTFEEMASKLNWVNFYGGASFYNDKNGFKKLIKVVLKAKMYSLKDKIKYLIGEKYTLKYLFKEFSTVNLFEEIESIDVPIIFFHGLEDFQVPIVVARNFYEHLKAPYKKFISLEDCAHGLLIEYPELFKEKLLEEISKISSSNLD